MGLFEAGKFGKTSYFSRFSVVLKEPHPPDSSGEFQSHSDSITSSYNDVIAPGEQFNFVSIPL